MSGKQFRVIGRFRMGEALQPFVKEVRSDKEKHAIEAVYSELGSKHRTPRSKIIIEKVEEVKP